MSRNYSQKRRLKYVLLAMACTATFSMSGIAAACSTTEKDDEDNKTTSKEDLQLLKNGNFEFFDVPEQKKDEKAPIYLINNPNNWSHGGTSSYSMSGIIGTSEKAWEALTDYDLADKLDYNNALDSSASNYKEEHIDYNGMKSTDLLFKDTHAAIKYGEDDEVDKDEENGGEEVDPRKEFIKNPGTHYNVQKKSDGSYYYLDDSGKEQKVYVEENGDYYLLDEDEVKQPISHVLMLHNYATGHNGISQNYSSVEIDLPANTAAEISVWVKTTGLMFSQGTEVKQDRGATISVSQTVGSTSIDKFTISCINTEKLIKENKASDKYDGWVEYTVYVNACDFASSTVSLTLGLGESDYNVEGYAFFDDVTVTKYTDLDESSYSEHKSEIENGKATCTLTSDASEKIFKADSYSRNDGAIKDERSSKNFYYFVDLSSEQDYETVKFGNASVGLTADDDNYVSSLSVNGVKKLGFTKLNDLPDGAKLPVDFTALNTSNDFVGYFKAGKLLTESNTEYYSTLNTALKTAEDLPKLNKTTDNNVLVMLSAYGAAYTSSFDIEVAKEGNIVSFWLKTSDLKGNTAATVKITEKGNKDNSTSLTLDSTDIVTDIDEDNKDIYNGWVQCFFFIDNQKDEAKTLTVEFSFGNTTLKSTAVSAYKAGWVALANMQMLTVSEEVFGYTGSGDHTATLTLSEDEDKKTSVFDQAYGSQAHEIENGIVDPANYSGVNGSSSSVVNNGHVSIPFDDVNKNEYAGLINKDYVENYAKLAAGDDNNWYNLLLDSFNVSDKSAINAQNAWKEIFGSKSIQPLLIVNRYRDSYIVEKSATESNFKNYYVKNEDGTFDKVAADAEFDEDETYYSKPDVLMNYGFIGNEKTISSDSYTTVSVRVKVSRGAVAYVYLIDTAAGKNVLSFTTPSYSFYYDEDGNVLKAEPKDDATLAEQRANILYSPVDNGLYEDENGKLFANIWNYTKLYRDQTVVYLDKDKNAVSFDKLVQGETYYKEDGTTVANHYLVTSDNERIYEFKDGKYYYIVDGKSTVEVTPFDTEYARYDYSELNENYMAVIDGNKSDVANKWITVNFVIHTGSESKKYRLELWSGERENFVSGSQENSSVIFDYSYTNVSDDTLSSEYESEIIRAYQELIAKADGKDFKLPDTKANISYYKELVEQYIKDGKLKQSDIDKYDILNNYTAHYYTYSLYDSADYVPFNKDTADENATGYDYSVNSYSESLAYLAVKDSSSVSDTEGYVYTVFADYATIDNNISLSTDTDDGNDDDTDEEKDNSSVWLLASSIVLVVVLLFAMLAIFAKSVLKKAQKRKVLGNNNYNHQKTNRYIRKLHIKKEEIEEVEPDDAAPSPVEQTPEENAVEPEASEENAADESSESGGESEE